MARRRDAHDGVDGDRDDAVLPASDEFDEQIDDGLDEESYRRLSGQRRSRLWRQRAVFGVIVALVLAVGGGAALVYTDRWDPGSDPEPAAAPGPACQAPAAPQLLPPAEVSVAVLNGTGRRGLAATVAAELRTRGFVVPDVANAPVPAGPVTAVVSYPPAQLQQAVTVGARFPEARLAEDPAAATVAVSLGDGYQQLLAEDALSAPVPAPAAPLPAGCPPG